MLTIPPSCFNTDSRVMRACALNYLSPVRNAMLWSVRKYIDNSIMQPAGRVVVYMEDDRAFATKVRRTQLASPSPSSDMCPLTVMGPPAWHLLVFYRAGLSVRSLRLADTGAGSSLSRFRDAELRPSEIDLR